MGNQSVIFLAVHMTDLSSWQHAHHFHSANVLGERNTRRVVVLTAVMMVVEITTGGYSIRWRCWRTAGT